jgi:flagellar basal-body rod modification protein FlgD
MTMAVNGVSGVGTSATTTSAAKASVDYQSFLKLLVAEMKNQDPTQPMDSTQYIAQLASFSQVEQSIQVNSKLDSLLQLSQLSQAGSIIGKTVTSEDETVSGVVNSVRLTSEGLVAVLDTGDNLLIGDGVTISDS